MKRLAQITLVAAAVALAAGSALAQQRQRPRGGFGGFRRAMLLFLLNQKSVQEELKLSDDQVTKVKELLDKQRDSFRGLRDLSREERQKKIQEQGEATRKAVAKLLKPEQLKRVRQVALQLQGARALNNPQVAKALEISDEQKEKIQEIQRSAFAELRGAGRGEEARKKRQEVMKATNEKIMGVLTAEQKTKLKKMQGAPFKGEIAPPFGGGRGRRER